jgi:hypothetical protein
MVLLNHLNDFKNHLDRFLDHLKSFSKTISDDLTKSPGVLQRFSAFRFVRGAKLALIAVLTCAPDL